MRVLMTPDYRADNPYQELLATALREQGVEVVFPTGYRRVLPITRSLREFGADVLHLHWVEPYLRPNAALPVALVRGLKTVADLLLARATGVRVVWTVHNEVSHESRFPRLERAILRQIGRLTDQVIVHEEARRGSYAGAAVIPHGSFSAAYEQPLPRADAHAALGLEVTGRVFLHFGMLRPYKGIEDLLEAWSLTHLGREHVLLIAGPSPDPIYTKRLEERARAISGVRFEPGFVPADRVHVVFSAADIVVLPYRKVATSGSAMLSLSFGRPLVVPALPTLLEVLGRPGPALFFGGDTGRSLAEVLTTAAQADLAPLRTAAADRVQGWEQVASATRDAYCGRERGSS
ncbi:MAG: glycosyltransferase [Planctomycetes bacterium]|nr:glycosyltransferase [Planctomycetota bacterium]